MVNNSRSSSGSSSSNKISKRSRSQNYRDSGQASLRSRNNSLRNRHSPSDEIPRLRRQSTNRLRRRSENNPNSSLNTRYQQIANIISSGHRRSERIQNQAILREAVHHNPDLPGPSFVNASQNLTNQARPSRSRSRSGEAQPIAEPDINPPRVNQDGRISFQPAEQLSNGMRLRSGRVKPRRNNRTEKNNRVNRRNGKRTHLSEHLNRELPYRISHILDQDNVAKEVQVKNSWSDRDKSNNIYLHDDGITLHRRPVSQSTDSIRGKVGYKSGVHVWEIKWIQTQRGTHACIGVATKDAPLKRIGYCALVGSNLESWGWDLGRNLLIHNDQNVVPVCYTNENVQSANGNTPYPMQKTKQDGLRTIREPFMVPDRFIMALDMDAGRLGFMAYGEWLGWAFGDFQGKELFPAVSCVWGHCEVTLKYMNFSHSPLSLQELSRRSVRQYLNPSTPRIIKKLEIPYTLKQYLRPDGLRENKGFSKLSKRRKLDEDSDSDINQN